VFDQLDREQGGVGDWDDLVIVTVHDQHQNVDGLELISEVGCRERLDAVEVRLDTAHPALAPAVSYRTSDTLAPSRLKAWKGPEATSRKN